MHTASRERGRFVVSLGTERDQLRVDPPPDDGQTRHARQDVEPI